MTVSKVDVLSDLLASIGTQPGHQLPEDTARLRIHGNQVLDSHLVDGLEIDVEEQADGIAARIVVREGAVLAKPVHVCFGLLPERGLQCIDLHIDAQADSHASILAHCTFPNAVEVEHRMDAEIRIGPGATYSYFERHVHGKDGGVVVLPKAKVWVSEGARFKTEFELIKGSVGRIDIEYDTVCEADSVTEMIARISGRGDDSVNIREIASLNGARARAVLESYIALRDNARAEIYNELTANAPYARGHVDCREIVQDQAVARAVPIVQVNHPTAHVTHEAAIGSVDAKQLETLLARGLDEDQAVELIIEGLLS